jgi:hypothetical protein
MDIQIVKGEIPFNRLSNLYLTLEEKMQLRSAILKLGDEKYILIKRDDLKRAMHSSAKTELCTVFLSHALSRELQLDIHVGRTTIDNTLYYYIILKR